MPFPIRVHQRSSAANIFFPFWRQQLPLSAMRMSPTSHYHSIKKPVGLPVDAWFATRQVLEILSESQCKSGGACCHTAESAVGLDSRTGYPSWQIVVKDGLPGRSCRLAVAGRVVRPTGWKRRAAERSPVLWKSTAEVCMLKF